MADGAVNLKSQNRILVLGFYDRDNLGDEQYKITIPLWFGNNHAFDFMCIDDICNLSKEQRDGYHQIIVGGGDVINAYFMEQVKPVLSSYTGPVYAFSVGIPYKSDVHYLDMFDHVVTRSTGDFELASTYLGSSNVTCMPDVGFTHPFTAKSLASDCLEVGVCLATPVVDRYPTFVQALAIAMETFVNEHPKRPVKYHFFLFNTHQSDKECDIVAVQQVLSACSSDIRDMCVVRNEVNGAHAMLSVLSSMKFVMCMRYHSLVFAVKSQAPSIVLATTPKINRLAKDLNHPDALIVTVDEHIEAYMLSKAMMKRCETVETSQVPKLPNRLACDSIHASGYRNLLLKTPIHTHDSFDKSMTEVKQLLNAFYGHEKIDDDVLHRKASFAFDDKSPLQLSRIICFGLTKDFDHTCVWGLAENMMRDDFVLYEACDYIYAFEHSTRSSKKSCSDIQNYCPSIAPGLGRVFLDIDPLDFKIGDSHVHRSGWKYVTNHIANLDAKRFGKQSQLILDTYIDRTFHWGMDSLVAAKLLPYKSAWAGFLHHTFDISHSVHNNVELFKNEVFQESLQFCKCIFVMSEYLAEQVRDALESVGHPHVQVHVIYHPTESVPQNRLFTMSRFMKNTDRKVVQIGAWLRNPYSIFHLALPEHMNRLSISKAALKGRHMEGYYITDEQYQTLLKCLFNNVVPQSPIHACDGYEYPCITTKNKHMYGLAKVVQANYLSVELLKNLDNDSYDALLTQHIVFLDLVDCSAANTVIECVVRNTIIIVNRHPAVEEVLGVSYPGFYRSIHEATSILCSPKTLLACYKHIAHLDKSQLDIETFMIKLVQVLKTLTS
jgi:hypothetical protein